MESLLLIRQLNAREIRQIAVDADADPRTVKKVIEGRSSGTSAAERVEKALRRRGLVVERKAKGA